MAPWTQWRELTLLVEPEHGHIIYRYPFVKHAPQSNYINSFTDSLRSLNYSGMVPDNFMFLVENFQITFSTATWRLTESTPISDALLDRLKLLRAKCGFMFQTERAVIYKRALYRKTIHSQDMFDSIVDRAITKLKTGILLSANERTAIDLYARDYGISGDSDINVIKLYEFKQDEHEHMALLTEEMLIETREFVQQASSLNEMKQHDILNYRIAA